MNLIELKNIKKKYKIGFDEFAALHGVNLTIKQGEFVAIMGPSGSGKSTLMHILGCLDNPSSGEYFLNGKNVAGLGDDTLSTIRNLQIGFVFQSFNLLSRLTVLENVMLPFSYSNSVNFKSKSEKLNRAKHVLELVGLKDKIQNKPNQLSGGQVQRVAIARSIVMKPSIILADEPTGNLDSKTSNEIMNIFKNLNKEGNTIILITHEEDIARNADRIIKIKDGLVDIPIHS